MERDPSSSSEELIRKFPTVVLVIGMAGSGKTTYVKCLREQLEASDQRVYTINLDPAVASVPYKTNVDIRDTVNYGEIMKQYKLGPNGAIMTALNLFATRIDKLIGLIEKRAAETDYVIIDTPGQIEVFNWSASGQVILDSLSICFPTTVVYILDTARCQSPITFMSNMIYACSVLYKCQLPFLLCFNKIDVVGHEICLSWMEDPEALQIPIQKEDSYMASFSFSCSLAIAEFYKNIQTVGVSSSTGEGMRNLIKKLAHCREEYFTDFFKWILAKEEDRKKKKQEKAEKDFEVVKDDMKKC